MMTRKVKKGIVTLLGGAGIVVLLVPVLTGAYPFSWGVIAAISLWIITGAVATMLGIRKSKNEE